MAPSRGRLSVEREQIELVRRNGLRLLKLVNTLLDFSRLEAGRIQAHYEPIDIAAYTAELASTFQSAMDKAGLRYVIDCAPLAATDLCRSRHVGEDRPQFDFERFQVHL